MPDITSNLELLYTFDSDDATDTSGNSRNGTVEGSASFSSEPSSPVSGNNVFVSADPGGYISTGYNDTFTEITITCWVYLTEPAVGQGIVLDVNLGNDDFSGFQFNGSGELGYAWNGHASETTSFSSGLTLTEDDWYFCALVIKADSATIYRGISGTLVHAKNNITHAEEDTGGQFYVGRGNGDNLTAYMDDVRIYSRALTQEDIETLSGMTDSVPEDLELWYEFDVGGSPTPDSSGNGRVGTFNGSIDGATGIIGDAILLDTGTSDYVDTGYSDTFNEITITCWIYLTATPQSYAGIVFARNGFDTGNGLGFRDNSGQLGYTWNDNSSTTYGWASGLTVNTGEWTFCALVIKSNRATIYRAVGSTLVHADRHIYHIPQTTGTFLVGRDAFDTRYLDANVDDVRIYSRALNQAEIEVLTGLSDSTTAGTEDPTDNANCLAVYTFDDGSITGATVTDASGSGNNGTLTGGPAVTNGYIGCALQLGSGKYMTVPDMFRFPTSGVTTTEYDFSAAMWFKTTQDGIIFGQTGSGYSPAIYIDSGGYIRVSLFYHLSSNPLSSVGTYDDGEWHHVVVTYSNGAETLYIDGAYDNYHSVEQSGYSDTYGYFIGFGNSSGWNNEPSEPNYFNGAVDEVRFYLFALTSGQVETLYEYTADVECTLPGATYYGDMLFF